MRLTTANWRVVGTNYTNGTGDYTFDGLRDGYLQRRGQRHNFPIGMSPPRRAEPNPAGNGTGFTCGTCDGRVE